MVQLQYRIKTGRKLNLKNPQRYTEKLQWYKLYYKNPLMIQCVDKYDVRAYVESKGLGHILNECYGVFERVEDIDFDFLPNQFVIKDTLGGGGNSVILVRDKSQMDLEAVKAQLNKWVHENHRIRTGGREWPYYSGKRHRIIIEKYLAQPDGDLPDYKFFCFEGIVRNYYVRTDYAMDHKGKTAFFDHTNAFLHGVGMDYTHVAEKKPELNVKKVKEMVMLSESLAQGFPHVRVDLFLVNQNIYFGEMTFYNASGYMTFEPNEFDFVMGSKFLLPKE